jgi:hypothetical protein
MVHSKLWPIYHIKNNNNKYKMSFEVFLNPLPAGLKNDKPLSPVEGQERLSLGFKR